MKNKFLIPALAVLCLAIFSACAQMSGPSVPQFGNGLEKLFGSNQTFSATMEMNASANGSPMTISGKMSFDKGNSRFEMDISQMKGGNIPPDAVSMMKSAGLDHMVTISQSDKKNVYIIYPNAQSYAEMTPAASDANATNQDSSIQITELGKETVDGHDCVKNKAIVTDKQGNPHEFTVWNATDFKNFPIKVAMNEQDQPMTMSFKDINFSKPDASLFIPPTGYTKYDTMQEMVMQVMMKKMNTGTPPPQQ